MLVFLATLTLDVRLVEGFVAVVLSSALINKAGDIFYRKGIAKPFYVLGHRLHHKTVLKTVIPASYVAVASLIYVHYLRIVWSTLWLSVELTIAISVACLAFDMALDALLNSERRKGILHHEWLYLIVPVYALTHLVAFV